MLAHGVWCRNLISRSIVWEIHAFTMSYEISVLGMYVSGNISEARPSETGSHDREGYVVLPPTEATGVIAVAPGPAVRGARQPS
jgi:hypothetical protein